MLLLDLRLDIQGSQLLPLLRRVSGCEHVPVVAVTAEHEFDIRGTGFARQGIPATRHPVLGPPIALLGQQLYET